MKFIQVFKTERVFLVEIAESSSETSFLSRMEFHSKVY